MKNILKGLTIPFVAVAILYLLFLILPILASPFLNSQAKNVEELIKQSAGFDAKVEKISLVTSWNFSVGAKVGNLELSIPQEKEPFLQAQNVGIKMSILPILARKIQLDSLFADDVFANVVIKEDGTLLLMDSLPKTEESSPESFELPLGLRLSNRLPDVKVGSYLLAMTDRRTSRQYTMQGENFRITNFVLDKSIKISTKGNVKFEDVLISNYDLKIYNKIMPNLQLHDLIFPEKLDVEEDIATSKQSQIISLMPVLDVFKAIKKNQFGANIFADLKIAGNAKEPKIDGKLSIGDIVVAVDGKKLPSGFFNMKSKGNKTELDSVFFTSFDKSESTKLSGIVKSGKNKFIDVNFKSNAKFQNIINLADSVAKSFNINDLDTLSATGGIDADLHLKSDLKKNTSSGYLKVLPSSLNYGLYNVKIDNITADVDLNDNNININKSGFSILGQPLSLTGTIASDGRADLNLTADKLSLKGLLMAVGQIALLKENDVRSGFVSLSAKVKGKLAEIKPEILTTIDNVDILNKASQAKITLQNALVKVLYDGKAASGNVDVNSANVFVSGSKLSVPKAAINIDEKNININNTYLMVNNSRIDVKGSIRDYLNDKLFMNISANGGLQSADIASFLPVDFRKMISYKGSMPLNVYISGNAKVQKIEVDLSANPNNYISLIDLQSLKGQNTKIHSSMEIIGDTLTFSNTSLANSKTTIAKLGGDVSKLSSNPKLNLNISVPSIESFPIWGMQNSNISANGNVSVVGSIDNPQVRGTVNVTDISIKDMDFKMTDLVADLSGEILNGSATAKQMKFGGIVATDIAGKFSLKDYSKFYLTDATAKSFDGNVSGKLSYDIPTFAIATEFKGTGLNSTKAVEGAVGIKNALTGTMGFDGKLTMKGVTDKEIINSMKGNLNFNVVDGKFVSIGKIENLVAAQNVNSNSILKSAISALSGLATINETDKFKYIKGEMTFANGTANLSKILVSGPLMSYYVNGSYNIIPNSAALTILGRLDAKVVSVLGPLGQLSADKLLSYIPKFGAATASILKQLSSDPASENTALIPELSSGSKEYKDFKVVFNGNVENPSSVRSFKWLSACDTSQLDIKQDLENAAKAVQSNINTTIENTQNAINNAQKNIDNAINVHKNRIEEAKKELQQTKTDIQNLKQNSKQGAENLKNLFQNAIKNSQTQMQTTPSAQE